VFASCGWVGDKGKGEHTMSGGFFSFEVESGLIEAVQKISHLLGEEEHVRDEYNPALVKHLKRILAETKRLQKALHCLDYYGAYDICGETFVEEMDKLYKEKKPVRRLFTKGRHHERDKDDKERSKHHR
jgi:hypothetical protein